MSDCDCNKVPNYFWTVILILLAVLISIFLIFTYKK